MFTVIVVVGVVLAIVALFWWLGRVGELFFVSVRDGKLLVVRGRVPISMLQEFAEAVKDPTVRRGSIRAFKGETGGRLECSGGIAEGREQRMRNTFMLYPISQLRQAPAVSSPTIGQMAGVAWLAWMLDRRR